jgi:uncharacterized protein YbjT (DUF2867 family)
MSQETILVTGAAGSVGSTARTAITILLEQGHRVRAMVRKLDARADMLRDLGAEVVVADMLDIVAVRAAMQGCSVVYFTISVSPNYLEAAADVAVTAKSLGVKAFVNLSQMTLSQMSETETTGSPEQKQSGSRADAALVRPAGGLPASNRFFDGMFLVQRPRASATTTPSACRSPTARPRRSPPRTWGLPPQLCWPTQRRMSARSTT